MINLISTPKGYATDQDKLQTPEQTLASVKEKLNSLNLDILSTTKRIDINRLGIPVFLSICGNDAKKIMPTRKQMGKGASLEQAEASALMELMERYGFFSFWQRLPNCTTCTYSEAEKKFGNDIISLEEIIKACHDNITPAQARRILDMREWRFFPATRITDQRTVYLPLDLFKQLGEFNGSSAGNNDVESILQGSCELVERHVCAIVDKQHCPIPTIDQSSINDPILLELLDKFHKNGVEIILKDASLGMPVPTVIALAKDGTTFPISSEIVLTAGTSTSPTKAAIRAITEVAQLAGDFCTSACYEASGLPKYSLWSETAWLRRGAVVSIDTLPDISQNDMLEELLTFAKQLNTQEFNLYSISTTNPDTMVPSHYNIVPGFQFRERDKNASLGLFAGRMISEQENLEKATAALQILEEIYPCNHFVPFFQGMLCMRQGNLAQSRDFFSKAEPLQPESEALALVSFYLGYTHTLEDNWQLAEPYLQKAAKLCPDMKEYLNLLGVCFFKQEKYAKAAEQFESILNTLDKGSVMDMQNLGVCHYKLGNREKSIHFLSSALEIDSGLQAAATYLEKALELEV